MKDDISKRKSSIISTNSLFTSKSNITNYEESLIKSELYSELVNIEQSTRNIPPYRVAQYFFEFTSSDMTAIVDGLIRRNKSHLGNNYMSDFKSTVLLNMVNDTTLVLNYHQFRIISLVMLNYLAKLREQSVTITAYLVTDSNKKDLAQFNSFFEFCQTVKKLKIKIKYDEDAKKENGINLDFIYITLLFLRSIFKHCLECEISFSLNYLTQFIDKNGVYPKVEKLVKYYENYISANFLIALMLQESKVYKFTIKSLYSHIDILKELLNRIFVVNYTNFFTFLDSVLIYNNLFSLNIHIDCLDPHLFSKMNAILCQHSIGDLTLRLFDQRSLSARKLKNIIINNLNSLPPNEVAMFYNEFPFQTETDFADIKVGDERILLNYLLSQLERNFIKLVLSLKNSKILNNLEVDLRPNDTVTENSRITFLVDTFILNLLTAIAEKKIIQSFVLIAPFYDLSTLRNKFTIIESHSIQNLELNAKISPSFLRSVVNNSLITLKLLRVDNKLLSALLDILLDSTFPRLKDLELALREYSLTDYLDKKAILAFLSTTFPTNLEHLRFEAKHLMSPRQVDEIKKKINLPIPNINLVFKATHRYEFTSYCLPIQHKVLLSQITKGIKDNKQIRTRIAQFLTKSQRSLVIVE